MRAAAPLHPHDRVGYLEMVTELLNARETGDGVVARAARKAQARFLRPRDLSRSNGQSNVARSPCFAFT
jgi:hypothetical protein